MPRRFRHWPHRIAVVLAFLVAGCGGFYPGNPLIGRWTLTAPLGTGFSLGTYEFSPSSMEALGVEQKVEYSVSGDTVLVVPEGFGPTLEVEMIDRDTARLKDPLTGGLLTLHRLR